ncbi:transcriptional regulator GlxA family with amidase domain [Dyadobacter sp. BE34]|uniref:Transcriptional regulator GlxA family with amidase domain n=1 Tax=Dyadobacter fermentans TaxID=94254 RepID=A0ABU1QYZ2_9BACT|nr:MULTISPECIES: helix-turn-helix domain-containing protein [Dyadobacter]MDR6805955.1 transcriptional regulator GlxA family with amidase domain [Dyadobacter fermentans]MDR7043695.1 transcriptional regulator GlxA family with amidase domain [Dyadobacter sp. BE242]MDR7198007.1 transcriptional regulator GlxA family with amidase domain [Dyadobacter sp. BE34]MDR7215969.1 transcriptional regulator GlxA family with amidase domain [Dyadobacter sp. BE31]MDR7264505.1 transcriptional regulator GlxA family
MKHISILALHDATINSIDSSYQMLSRVNDFLRYQGKQAFYTVEIVGLENSVKLGRGLYRVTVDKTIHHVAKTDVAIIPLLCGDFAKALQSNEGYADWLIRQYNMGAELVTLCVGSFFLASTGLLNGRSCAVHWAAKNEFESLFPQVSLIEDRIITDEAGIYTCAGGYSYLNLLLYVIEKHLGREISILASKMFEIDIDRKSQNPFRIFMGQKRHEDKEILSAQDFIERNPTELLNIEEICTMVSLGRRTFERRFKKCTGNSVAAYIQRVKVEFAKKQLESTTDTINEIVYNVGYDNIDAFRKVFKKYTDLTPLDYRRRYYTAPY